MEIYDIILINIVNNTSSNKLWKLKKRKTFTKNRIIYAFQLIKVDFIYFQRNTYFKLKFNNNINYKKHYINNQY